MAALSPALIKVNIYDSSGVLVTPVSPDENPVSSTGHGVVDTDVPQRVAVEITPQEPDRFYEITTYYKRTGNAEILLKSIMIPPSASSKTDASIISDSFVTDPFRIGVYYPLAQGLTPFEIEIDASFLIPVPTTEINFFKVRASDDVSSL